MLFCQDYREIIRHEFNARVKRNPRYSLRAFSKLIQLAPARLSDVLNYKKGLSRISAATIANALGFNERDTEFFCSLVESVDARKKESRIEAKEKIALFVRENRVFFLESDVLEMISDSGYLTLLQLLKIFGYEKDVKSYAQKLGKEFTEIEVNAMLERLQRLDLIRIEEKKIVVLHESVACPDGMSSSVIRNIHSQILSKASQAVEQQTLDERDLFAMVLPFDVAKLPMVRTKIRDFVNQLTYEHGEAKTANSVYCLSTQFFKLAK